MAVLTDSDGIPRAASVGRPPFPSGYRGRLALYLVLQAAVFLAPGFGILVPAAVILALGRRAGIRWGTWTAGLGALLGVILLPAAAGLPEAWAGRAAGLPGLLSAWTPALRRSAAFYLVLASAAWLSRTSRVEEIREALEALLRPFGARGRRAALTAALALVFLPWTRYELSRADEAVRLRGADPRRSPLRYLSALGVPLVARLLEKSRLTSEALTLRDPDSEGSPAARRVRVH